MIAAARVAAMAVGALFVWLVVASQMPSHVRLSLGEVVVGAVISQKFGCTSLELEPVDPFCPGGHIHTGVDLAAPTGTEVRSATFGVARLGFDPNGAGMFVVVTADAHVRLFYCHLSAFRTQSGATVAPGQLIGLVGATGRATGSHVHFEVQVDRTSVDPVAWLAS
ncbi:MAG TPA: M23 family metallopeptidase [Candidatus Dormibacteraeota bacterium]